MILNDEIDYKEEIRKSLKEICSIKTFYKQIPNLLTFSRAIGGPIVGIIFLLGHPVAALLFLSLLLLTDLFDGKLARKWGVVSKFGADLDAFCDKIMFLGLSFPLLVSNPIILLNFLFEGIISLINVVGRLKGLETKTVFSGKVKAWFLSMMLGSGYLVKFFNFPVKILNVLVGATFISQGLALIDYVKEYKKMESDKEIKVDILNILDDNVSKEEIYTDNRKLIDDLKREREKILNSCVEIENKPLSRKRKFGKK